jgi:hypothetical protein
MTVIVAAQVGEQLGLGNIAVLEPDFEARPASVSRGATWRSLFKPGRAQTAIMINGILVRSGALGTEVAVCLLVEMLNKTK